MLRSNRDMCSNWNALVAAAETIDNRPTEKGLETQIFFWQFPIPECVTIMWSINGAIMPSVSY